MRKIIYIEGMQCNHCKVAVEEALKKVEGVQEVQVSVEEKRAIIEYKKEIDKAILQKAIEEIGFEATKIEEV